MTKVVDMKKGKLVRLLDELVKLDGTTDRGKEIIAQIRKKVKG